MERAGRRTAGCERASERPLNTGQPAGPSTEGRLTYGEGGEGASVRSRHNVAGFSSIKKANGGPSDNAANHHTHYCPNPRSSRLCFKSEQAKHDRLSLSEY